MSLKIFRKKKVVLWLLVLFLLLTLIGVGFSLQPKILATFQNRFQPQNPYIRFSSDVYDVIKTNYWEKIDEAKFTNLYKLTVDKLAGSPQTLTKPNKEGVLAMIDVAIKNKKPDEKKVFVTTLADAVLANLQPFGRSRLYTQKLETQLRENVANIDRSVNLYDSLGVDKTASSTAIAQAFTEKKQELEKEASPDAKQKLAQVERAYQALAQDDTRKRYDNAGIEPTLLVSFPSPVVAYVNLKKFSPTTPEELTKVFTNEIDPTKQWIILDMRGNGGGAIDMLQLLLGPFIGANVAGYEFFHQGEYIQFRTQTPRVGEVGIAKKLIVLVDKGTQSSAELMAAALKKYNVAIVVGTTTHGWGTVENVFPIKDQIDDTEKYSVFLVHSITIRDDGTPIEGKGVDPQVDITKPDWQAKFQSYIPSYDVLSVVQGLVK